MDPRDPKAKFDAKRRLVGEISGQRYNEGSKIEKSREGTRIEAD